MSNYQATDFGEPQLNSTADILIEVIDVNDEPPRFYTDPYLAHVQENLDPGQKVWIMFTISCFKFFNLDIKFLTVKLFYPLGNTNHSL